MTSKDAFVCDLATDQGLCLLGSENVVVEGMYADSGSLFSGIGGIELG
jgi:hypothetical protein